MSLLTVMDYYFQIFLGLLVESPIQGGANFHAQLLLELSWSMLAELVVPHTVHRGEQREKFVCLRIPTTQMKQQACLQALNMVEYLVLSTNLILDQIV